MTEDKLSSDIVTHVRNNLPQTRGRFFHISNERNNKTQAYIAKAIGIFAGVSDFIYFELFHPRENGTPAVKLVGLEVKVPNTRHEVEHIEQQVCWGEILEESGGVWRMILNKEDALECVKGNYKGYTTQQVREMLQNIKTKTILIK